MSQGDQFHQYGYDHYLKAPKNSNFSSREHSSCCRSGLFSALLYWLGTTPLFRKFRGAAGATVVFLGAALLFVGVVVMTYSSSDDAPEEALSIVGGDLGVIKHAPDNPGGMEIPYRKSTILAREDQPSPEAQNRVVENLLARERESTNDLISKEEAFYRATQSPVLGAVVLSPASLDGKSSLAGVDGKENQASVQVFQTAQKPRIQDDLVILRVQAQGGFDGKGNAQVIADQQSKSGDILQKIGSVKDTDSQGRNSDHFSMVFIQKTVDAALALKPNIPVQAQALLLAPINKETRKIKGERALDIEAAQLHNAGKSPKTLAYVRSVLDGKSPVSHDSGGVKIGSAVDVSDVPDISVGLQKIEPVAGNPSADISVSMRDVELGAGSYFVQLSSITDAKRAPGEWAKMQDKYSVLDSSNFRVQEAALSSGTFYRIQAGPMSKKGADHVCGVLKAASKPGGCLVVQ